MVFPGCCLNVSQYKVNVWCFLDVVFFVGQCKVNVWCFLDVVLMLASIRSVYGVSRMLF